jgi:hypothetical protein
MKINNKTSASLKRVAFIVLSKVTNKYIFKSLPKDKKYKVVMKLPNRATQIINLG